MIFETYSLPPELKDHIESIFYYKDFIPDHSIERVVPTGHLFILFELDGFERNTFDNETLEPNGTFKNVWVSGMHKNYISISAHEKSEMLVIQFKPYGARPFIHHSIEALNDKVVDSEGLFGDDLLELRKQILKTKDVGGKFESIASWLSNRFEGSLAPSQEIVEAVHQIQANSIENIKPVIENYSKTQKHLIDEFKKYLGLTPKYLQRIYRFNELLQVIHNKEKFQWTHVALDCGYTDQSHFIKEFKHFCGINPQDFISDHRNHQEPNFFPLDSKEADKDQ